MLVKRTTNKKYRKIRQNKNTKQGNKKGDNYVKGAVEMEKLKGKINKQKYEKGSGSDKEIKEELQEERRKLPG